MLWHFSTHLYNAISCSHYQNISFWYKKLISFVFSTTIKSFLKLFLAYWLIKLKMGNAVWDCKCKIQCFSYYTFWIWKSCKRDFKCEHDNIFEFRYIYAMYIQLTLLEAVWMFSFQPFVGCEDNTAKIYNRLSVKTLKASATCPWCSKVTFG